MLAQKLGKIVNISSIRGIDHCGREGIMDYHASKGAVINLTKTMAKELAPHINVNTVAPGHTLTEMTAPLPDEIKKTMIEGSYLKRIAQPRILPRRFYSLPRRMPALLQDRSSCRWGLQPLMKRNFVPFLENFSKIFDIRSSLFIIGG